MIEATFTLSEAEFIAAQKLYQRDALRKIVRQRWQVAIIALLSICGVIELEHETRNTLWSPLTLALLAPAIMIYGIICASFSKSHYQKAYKLGVAALTNLHVELDELGYRFEIAGITHGFVSWIAFSSWMEDASVFVLGRGSLFYPIPKSALTLPQIEALRALCLGHVRPSSAA